MPLVYTPAVRGGANPASGSYLLDPQYVNSGVDILQASYGYNINGLANADQLLQRDAILAILEYALKDTAFVNAIQAVAAGSGVTTPASFVSACVTKLTAQFAPVFFSKSQFVKVLAFFQDQLKMELILVTGLILGFFIILFAMFLVTVVALNKVEEDFAPTIDDQIDNFFMVSQANDN